MTKYRAKCDSHEWEGAARDDPDEAEKDLEGHVAYFPDEDHDGARVDPE